MKNFVPFLNPFAWVKAYSFARKNAKFDKSEYDLELYLYSKMLTNNMLHYGYFQDTFTRPETISFEQIEAAQVAYADNIVQAVLDKENPVLDVGCGMGGLSHMLHTKGFNVESLTPNRNQIEFINKNFKDIITHHCKFEQLKPTTRYGTIINSESLQYITLDEAFKRVDEIILPKGRWIIVDYFDLNFRKENQKPHHLEAFYQKIKGCNWNIVQERDITLNILPSLAFINMYVNRFLIPAKHFAYEKFRFKSPKLFYLSERLRKSVDKKFEKETKTVNPEEFMKGRKYIFFVLEKN